MSEIRFIKHFPALKIRDKRNSLLLVADLHIGFEKALSEKGINIPSQTNKMQNALCNLVEKYKVDKLIILGDLKHNIPNISLLERQDIPEMLKKLSEVVEVEIIPGNHDGDIDKLTPSQIKIHDVRGIQVGYATKIGLLHGHTWPNPELLKAEFLVMGHAHPTVLFNAGGYKITQPVWVKAPIIKKELERVVRERMNVRASIKVNIDYVIVMPAFNPLLGGSPINYELKDELLLGPLLTSGVVQVKEAELLMLDGTFLGKLSQIKELSSGE